MTNSTNNQSTESESAGADGPNENILSEYGIHKRKIGGKLFKSFGLGNFFINETAAEKLAEAERELGSISHVVKVTNGWRVFLRDAPIKEAQEDLL